MTSRAPGLEDSLIHSADVRRKGTLPVGRRAGAFGQYLDPLKLHREYKEGGSQGARLSAPCLTVTVFPVPKGPPCSTKLSKSHHLKLVHVHSLASSTGAQHVTEDRCFSDPRATDQSTIKLSNVLPTRTYILKS